MSEANTASRRVRIVNELGLHARAAARLVKLASSYSAVVHVEKDGQRADAKSIMGVLLLCGEPGAILTLHAEGPDAKEAVDALHALVRDRFGEGR